MEFQRTIEAAAQADRSLWPLADALLADIPMSRKGIDNGSRVRLEQCQAALAEQGFEYGIDHLSALRRTAHTFPNSSRVPFATLRTHQEALGDPALLRKLASVLEGSEPGDVPKALRERIRARGRVTANDFREASGRRSNLPTREPEALTAAQVTQAIEQDPEIARAVGQQIRTNPNVARSMAELGGEEPSGEPVDLRSIAREAEERLGPDLVGPITRLNLIVSELKAQTDGPEQVARALLDYQRPGIIRSLGESASYLGEVYKIASNQRLQVFAGDA